MKRIIILVLFFAAQCLWAGEWGFFKGLEGERCGVYCVRGKDAYFTSKFESNVFFESRNFDFGKNHISEKKITVNQKTVDGGARFGHGYANPNYFALSKIWIYDSLTKKYFGVLYKADRSWSISDLCLMGDCKNGKMALEYLSKGEDSVYSKNAGYKAPVLCNLDGNLIVLNDTKYIDLPSNIYVLVDYVLSKNFSFVNRDYLLEDIESEAKYWSYLYLKKSGGKKVVFGDFLSLLASNDESLKETNEILKSAKNLFSKIKGEWTATKEKRYDFKIISSYDLLLSWAGPEEIISEGGQEKSVRDLYFVSPDLKGSLYFSKIRMSVFLRGGKVAVKFDRKNYKAPLQSQNLLLWDALDEVSPLKWEISDNFTEIKEYRKNGEAWVLQSAMKKFAGQGGGK